jgi:nucleotide-binding universal stress UspA family protein
MKKILVPCDFSKPSVNAFRRALVLANRTKGSIELLHIIELPVLHDTMLMPVLNFEEALLKDLEAKATTSFIKMAEKYNTEQVKVTWTIEFGGVCKTILDHIQANSIDTVVMGSHGASGLREYFIGSNAERIVRMTTVPVLIVKEFSKGGIKNIIFPNNLDLEDQDDLLQKVKSIQNYFGAQLHIVWINTPLNFTSDVITRQRLEEFAKYFSLKNYTLNIFNHPTGNEGIVEFAKVVNADLIAMGTHGRKGFGHWLNGSIAEDVVNHSKGLVWTYSLKHEAVEV